MKAATTQHSRVIEKTPFYYGWAVLAAATFGLMMTTPGQTLGISVFLDRIIADLGVSRSQVSLMYTFGTLGGSLILPFVGRFIDRRGPRISVIIISSLFALACVWMGFVSGLVTLAIGFVLIRSLGQGALSLVSIHVVNIWFVRRRGLAVGLTGLGMALATALFPLLIEALVNALEWRRAYMALGGLVALTILPIGALLFRSHPERFGLRPDSSRAPKEEPRPEANYTAARARRTRTFWIFLSGHFLVAMLSTALVFHHYDIMASGDLDRVAAAAVFIPFAVVTASVNLITGFLMDRVPPRALLSVMLLLQTAALGVASLVTGSAMMLLYGCLLGTVQGMNGAISASVYAYYFGRAHIGAIKGFSTTITVAGTALGPFVVAVGFETFGSYTPILLLTALAPLLVAGIAPFFRPFRGDGSVA